MFVCFVTLFLFPGQVQSCPIYPSRYTVLCIRTSAHPLSRGQLTRNAVPPYVPHQTLASSRVPLLSVTVDNRDSLWFCRDPTRPVLLKAPQPFRDTYVNRIALDLRLGRIRSLIIRTTSSPPRRAHRRHDGGIRFVNRQDHASGSVRPWTNPSQAPPAESKNAARGVVGRQVSDFVPTDGWLGSKRGLT